MSRLIVVLTIALGAMFFTISFSADAVAQNCPRGGLCPAGTCSSSGTPGACDIAKCRAQNCTNPTKGVPTREVTGVDGKRVQVTISGRYSDCIRDSKKIGYNEASAVRYCNGLRAAGKVR